VAMRVLVENAGMRAAAEVVQCYISFPPSAGEPPLVLRAFHKTAVLSPSACTAVEIQLSAADLSIWSEQLRRWDMVDRRGIMFRIGASSADLRLNSTYDAGRAGMAEVQCADRRADRVDTPGVHTATQQRPALAHTLVTLAPPTPPLAPIAPPPPVLEALIRRVLPSTSRTWSKDWLAIGVGAISAACCAISILAWRMQQMQKTWRVPASTSRLQRLGCGGARVSRVARHVIVQQDEDEHHAQHEEESTCNGQQAPSLTTAGGAQHEWFRTVRVG